MNASDRNPASAAPAASVVTTVYNRAHTLARAMRSVLEQSFTDFEYIVVDDGSSDGSASVAESLPDPRITVIRAPHRGRAASLNTAFAACRGEFILIQDSDDVALPGRFEKQIAFLRTHIETGMVGCQCRLREAGAATFRTFQLPTSEDEILSLMMLTSAVVFGASGLRRDVAISVGGFDETLPAAEDYDFQLRMLKLSRLQNLAAVLQELHVSVDSQSVLRRTEQEHITMDRALAFLSEENVCLRRFQSEVQRLRAEALVHYYYGNIADARIRLSQLLRSDPLSASLWRYFLPTMFGSRMFNRFRGSGLRHSFTSILKRDARLRRHFLP